MVVFAPIVWLFKIAHFLRFLGMLNSHATNRILNLWKSDLVVLLRLLIARPNFDSQGFKWNALLRVASMKMQRQV